MVYIGAALVILWGISHLIPTKNVVNGFGDIIDDNKKIITMEWINEGLTLIFLGALVITANILGDKYSVLLYVVNIGVGVMLTAMAVLSLFTGFKVKFLPYKLCPIIFCVSAALICLGTFL